MSAKVIPHSFIHEYPPFETETIMVCTMSKPAFLYDFSRNKDEFRIIPLSFCEPNRLLFPNDQLLRVLNSDTVQKIEVYHNPERVDSPTIARNEKKSVGLHELSIVHLVGHLNCTYRDVDRVDHTNFYEPGLYHIYASKKSGHFHCALPGQYAPTLVPFGVTDTGMKLKERISDISGTPYYEMELEYKYNKGEKGKQKKNVSDDEEWKPFSDFRSVAFYGLKGRDHLRVIRHAVSRSSFVAIDNSGKKGSPIPRKRSNHDLNGELIELNGSNEHVKIDHSLSTSKEFIRVPQSALFDVPQHRILVPGLNFIGICQVGNCRLYRKEQIFHVGYGMKFFDQSDNETHCSSCRNIIYERTHLLINDCAFKYTSILSLNNGRYIHPHWRNVDFRVTQKRVKSKGWNDVSEDLILKFELPPMDSECILRLWVYPRWMKEKLENFEKELIDDREYCSICTRKLVECSSSSSMNFPAKNENEETEGEDEDCDEKKLKRSNYEQDQEEEEERKKKKTLVVIPKCEHVFHRICIENWKENKLESSDFCPRCQKGVVHLKRLRRRQRERIFSALGEFFLITIAVVFTIWLFKNNHYAL